MREYKLMMMIDMTKSSYWLKRISQCDRCGPTLVVTVHPVQLAFGRVSHLDAELGTQVNTAQAFLLWVLGRRYEYPACLH